MASIAKQTNKNEPNQNSKTLFIFFIIFVVLAFSQFFSPNSPIEKKRKNYFNAKIESRIISIEPNESGGRTYDFITKDSNILILYRGVLKVGDSVVKEKESWKYDAYRKDKKGDYYYYFKSGKLGTKNPNY